jgi:hypothetical protein
MKLDDLDSIRTKIPGTLTETDQNEGILISNLDHSFWNKYSNRMVYGWVIAVMGSGKEISFCRYYIPYIFPPAFSLLQFS